MVLVVKPAVVKGVPELLRSRMLPPLLCTKVMAPLLLTMADTPGTLAALTAATNAAGVVSVKATVTEDVRALLPTCVVWMVNELPIENTGLFTVPVILTAPEAVRSRILVVKVLAYSPPPRS